MTRHVHTDNPAAMRATGVIYTLPLSEDGCHLRPVILASQVWDAATCRRGRGGVLLEVMWSCKSAGESASTVGSTESGIRTKIWSGVGPATIMVPNISRSAVSCRRRLVDSGSRARSGSWLRNTASFRWLGARRFRSRIRPVSQSLHRTAARRRRLYDVKAVNRKYPVGSWVLRYYPPAAQKKLASPRIGPQQVVRQATGHTVGIQKGPDAPIIFIHVDDLKLCPTPHGGQWISISNGLNMGKLFIVTQYF